MSSQNSSISDEKRTMTRAILEHIAVTHNGPLHIGLRGAQAVIMLIAFITATATTGVGPGDYAYLISFLVFVYASVWTFEAMTKQIRGGQLLLYSTQLVVDSVLLVCLLAGGIALASSSWRTLCRSGIRTVFNCSAFYSCIVFLFLGVLDQLLMLGVLYYGRSVYGSTAPLDPASVTTPRADYQPAADVASCEL
ncbi:unnamed protein product [Aphanomyces euteiches]